VRRERAAGKVQTNFLLGPVFRNIKVKLPDSVIQISSDGLVKLKMEIGLENIFTRLGDLHMVFEHKRSVAKIINKAQKKLGWSLGRWRKSLNGAMYLIAD
jgi:hypothetical protein